jgi:hypothetical protein
MAVPEIKLDKVAIQVQQRAAVLLTKQLCSMGAKAERYNRPRKRHWHWRDDPRQLKLPFEEGD